MMNDELSRRYKGGLPLSPIHRLNPKSGEMEYYEKFRCGCWATAKTGKDDWDTNYATGCTKQTHYT